MGYTSGTTGSGVGYTIGTAVHQSCCIASTSYLCVDAYTDGLCLSIVDKLSILVSEQSGV